MMYSLSCLISMISDDKISMFRDALNKEYFRIFYDAFIINTIEPLLNLINIIEHDRITKIDICMMFDSLHSVYSINNDQARELIEIVGKYNYNIDTILCKCISSDAIQNIVNNVDAIINYDYVYTRALLIYSYNAAIIEYIISNDFVDYNSFNYYDKNYRSYMFLDVLLTNGFDISKFPIYDTNIHNILYYISVPNIKYFSNIKLSLSDYILMPKTLSSDKLQEFIRCYNTTNIVHYKNANPNPNVLKNMIHMLIDSGIDLKEALEIALGPIK
jgi:hypothetical protein